MKPIITPITSLEQMFGLPKGTVLNANGKLIGVFSAPKKGEEQPRWKVIERTDQGLISSEVSGGDVNVLGDGTVRLSVHYAYQSHYENGSIFLGCYRDYDDFLTGIGIPETREAQVQR